MVFLDTGCSGLDFVSNECEHLRFCCWICSESSLDRLYLYCFFILFFQISQWEPSNKEEYFSLLWLKKTLTLFISKGKKVKMIALKVKMCHKECEKPSAEWWDYYSQPHTAQPETDGEPLKDRSLTASVGGDANTAIHTSRLKVTVRLSCLVSLCPLPLPPKQPSTQTRFQTRRNYAIKVISWNWKPRAGEGMTFSISCNFSWPFVGSGQSILLHWLRRGCSALT